MEIENKSDDVWMDTAHPNYERWSRSRELSCAKGEFVKLLISQVRRCENLIILDLGSGEGGTSRVLSVNNTLISSDFDFRRLRRQKESNAGYSMAAASAPNLPFKPCSFDIIIMQDVIEHIETDISMLPEILFKLLKPGGIVYLSTPNKYSLINFLSDPHWGLPFISLMSRRSLRKFILPVFRKKDKERIGIARLLSLNDLNNLFGRHFEIKLNTMYAVRQLFSGSKAIAWSSFHLLIIKILNTLKLSRIIIKFANDSAGIINRYITPSYYIILSIKSSSITRLMSSVPPQQIERQEL